VLEKSTHDFLKSWDWFTIKILEFKNFYGKLYSESERFKVKINDFGVWKGQPPTTGKSTQFEGSEPEIAFVGV
jgi:hypothetical protein